MKVLGYIKSKRIIEKIMQKGLYHKGWYSPWEISLEGIELVNQYINKRCFRLKIYVNQKPRDRLVFEIISSKDLYYAKDILGDKIIRIGLIE